MTDEDEGRCRFHCRTGPQAFRDGVTAVFMNYVVVTHTSESIEDIAKRLCWDWKRNKDAESGKER